MINRVILLVVDGLGVGALPDAPEYGDAGVHTLAHLADAVGGLHLPTIESLGLGHVSAIKGLRVMAQPLGCFGRLGFQSKGVDAFTGHWELAGCIVEDAGPNYADGYPSALVAKFEQLFGRKTLGHRVSSGHSALAEYGREHMATGSPIVWTDGHRTCHVAVHEQSMPAEELRHRCRAARKMLHAEWGIWCVVAHPLTGAAESLSFGAGRRHFTIEPSATTMLDTLNRASQILIGVGPVGDLFGGRGLTRNAPYDSWTAVFDEVCGMFSKVPRGLIYAGLELLETDPQGSAAALQEFDRRLSEVIEQLRPGDLFVLTGNYGRDHMKPHALPTREYVPMLIAGPKLAQGVDLGIRSTAAHLGQTVVEALGGELLSVAESFLDALQAG